MEKHSAWFIVSDTAYFAALFIGAFFFFYILPRLVKKFKKTKNASNTKK
jgi:phosphoglycerate-specific signal transduction histidine kinase